MKKLLLLLFIACTAFSCSKSGSDDNTVRYDETKGYLTNLASAKYGIVGRWEISDAVTVHYLYNPNGTKCSGSYANEVLTDCDVTYDVIQKGGKYYIKGRNSSFPVGQYVEQEITTLTKTKLYFIPNTGSTTKLNRVGDVPNP